MPYNLPRDARETHEIPAFHRPSRYIPASERDKSDICNAYRSTAKKSSISLDYNGLQSGAFLSLLFNLTWPIQRPEAAFAVAKESINAHRRGKSQLMDNFGSRQAGFRVIDTSSSLFRYGTAPRPAIARNSARAAPGPTAQARPARSPTAAALPSSRSGGRCRASCSRPLSPAAARRCRSHVPARRRCGR